MVQIKRMTQHKASQAVYNTKRAVAILYVYFPHSAQILHQDPMMPLGEYVTLSQRGVPPNNF